MGKADLAGVIANLSGGRVPHDEAAFIAAFAQAYRDGGNLHP